MHLMICLQENIREEQYLILAHILKNTFEMQNKAYLFFSAERRILKRLAIIFVNYFPFVVKKNLPSL